MDDLGPVLEFSGVTDREQEGSATPSAEADTPRTETGASRLAKVIDLALLPSGARPIPFATLDFDEVPETRRLGCRDYAGCLQFAASVHWQGFSCRRCPRYAFESAEPPEATAKDAPLASIIPWP